VRGGARPGAGRPRGSKGPGPARRPVLVKLTEDEIAKGRALGQGNLTEGIRRGLSADPPAGALPKP
jgi:hypothetical protein